MVIPDRVKGRRRLGPRSRAAWAAVPGRPRCRPNTPRPRSGRERPANPVIRGSDRLDRELRRATGAGVETVHQYKDTLTARAGRGRQRMAVRPARADGIVWTGVDVLDVPGLGRDASRSVGSTRDELSARQPNTVSRLLRESVCCCSAPDRFCLFSCGDEPVAAGPTSGRSTPPTAGSYAASPYRRRTNRRGIGAAPNSRAAGRGARAVVRWSIRSSQSCQPAFRSGMICPSSGM